MTTSHAHVWRVWWIPALLAALTLCGLITSLLSEMDVYKWLGSTAAAIPVITATWFAFRRTGKH